MDLAAEVVRLREKLDGLSQDFVLTVQSFTSLHANIESDVEKLQAKVEKLHEVDHGLDKRLTVMEQTKPGDVKSLTSEVNELSRRLAVISNMLDEAKNGRYDITGAFRTHRADGASDPQPPARTPHEEPRTDWPAVIRDASTKWGPALAALAALVLAMLQQCGVVAPPPPAPARQHQTPEATSSEPH